MNRKMNMLGWLSAGALTLAVAAPAVSWAAPADQQEQKKEDRRADRPQRQRPDRAPRDGTPMLDRLYDVVMKLDLTDEQKPKLETIFDKAKEEMKTMRDQWDKNDTPMDQRRDEGMAFAKKLRDQVDEVLTKDQQKQLKQDMPVRGDMAARMFQNMQAALDKCNLTEDQQAKVKTVLDDAKAQLAKVRDQAKEDPKAAREEGRKIMEKTRTAIHDILTADQRETFRKAMAESMRGPGGPGAGGGRNGPPDGAGPADGPKGDGPKDGEGRRGGRHRNAN